METKNKKKSGKPLDTKVLRGHRELTNAVVLGPPQNHRQHGSNRTSVITPERDREFGLSTRKFKNLFTYSDLRWELR